MISIRIVDVVIECRCFCKPGEGCLRLVIIFALLLKHLATGIIRL